MLDVLRRGHLRGPLVVLRILPEVFKSASESLYVSRRLLDSLHKTPYSSVAFISGHDCGEQNSVIDP